MTGKSIFSVDQKRRRQSAKRAGRIKRSLAFEPLEPRIVLTAGPCAGPNCLQIDLIEEFDQFGNQFETIHALENDGETRVSFAIYDTGASVATFSPSDQLLFELTGTPIPIKVVGGAEADAIGGTLVGDVSEPGLLIADGLHAVTIDSAFNLSLDLSQAARAPGVQAFVGTVGGSPNLPTITGTPIHNPSPTHPGGVAALADMDAYQFDFGALFPEFPEFENIVIDLPDLRFVEPGGGIIPGAGASDPVRIPIDFLGEDNHLNPGDMITSSPNPVQNHVHLHQGAAEVSDQVFLFDTGAQLSVISTQIALDLNLDLNNPDTEIDVFGAGGSLKIPGFTIDSLELPRDDNADGVIDGQLRFTNVPIYVLDIIDGLDGILGTNLFNTADQLLYDPFDPLGASLSLTFFTDLAREAVTPEEADGLSLLALAFPTFGGALGGQLAPQFFVENGFQWQNTDAPLDVNANNGVTPLDALLVINDLNRNGAHDLPDPRLARDTSAHLDVNGDGFVAPLDALLVINFLNNPGAGAGESAAANLLFSAPGGGLLGGGLLGDGLLGNDSFESSEAFASFAARGDAASGAALNLPPRGFFSNGPSNQTLDNAAATDLVFDSAAAPKESPRPADSSPSNESASYPLSANNGQAIDNGQLLDYLNDIDMSHYLEEAAEELASALLNEE